MRVAVLVLASYAPRALFATATYFAPSDVDIFVHVDAKADLALFLALTGSYPPRVKFVDARRRVYWGGFSMVEATLDLLRAAVGAGPYERYVFISDNSLPVQSLDGFFATLGAHEDMIEAAKAPSPNAQRWYDGFYLLDDDQYDFRRNEILPQPVDEARQNYLKRMLAQKEIGKKPAPIYGGHASWALSPDSVRLVLDAADNDPWWVESCRFALFSDEVFFHSIVAAAKYPDGGADPPTYSDNFRHAPRAISRPVDLPLDLQPHFLFLRKIAPDFAPDLPQFCLQLYGGLRHMLAHDPALRAERIVAVSEGETPHLHLMAPIEDDPAWDARQSHRGRRYRRLVAQTTKWRLRAPTNWRHVRLSLPCVVGDSDAILGKAVFEIDGRRAPLAASDIGYRAEFADIARAFDTITLRLPPGERSELRVAVMPKG